MGSRKDKAGDLVLPFIFVPKGGEVAVEWLAAHPGAMRIPATMVPRGSAAGGWQLQFDPFASLAQGDARDANGSRNANEVPGGSARYPHPPNPLTESYAENARTRSSGPDGFSPTNGARVLRVADTSPAAAPGKRVPADRKGPNDPTAPVIFRDDHCNVVKNSEGKPMLRPAGLDPNFFVRQGLADRKALRFVLDHGDEDAFARATGFEIGRLSKFFHRGAWDAQRIGGKFHREYVDYATVTIGLYAASLGMSERAILIAQNLYALSSRYRDRTEFDKRYTNLPKANVDNTNLGYKLFEQHLVSPNEK